MSQWKLPVIDSKKQLSEDDDYNFVNKEKKKSKDGTGALGMIEELKRKIQDQKKQIENRNATIMGLQRNFQSLSGIVKHEKIQSAALKAELQNYRQNSQTGDKRASQFHQKCIILQNENKVLKEELQSAKKLHSQCYKMEPLCQNLKLQVLELEKTIQKMSIKIDNLQSQKRGLQVELGKLKGEDKNKRELNVRIIDLEDELKRSVDLSNNLNDKLKIMEHKVKQAKADQSNYELKLNEASKKVKQYEAKNGKLQNLNEQVNKQLSKVQQQMLALKSSMSSKDLYSKMKEEQQQKYRDELKSQKLKGQQLRAEVAKLFEERGSLQKQSENKSQIIKVGEKQIALLRRQVDRLREQFKNKEKSHLEQVQKLTAGVREMDQRLNQSQGKNQELNQKLRDEFQNGKNSYEKMQQLSAEMEDINSRLRTQNRYSKYFKQIDENESKVVVITNQEQFLKIKGDASEVSKRMSSTIAEQQLIIDSLTSDNESMKKYIGSLEQEVNNKQKQGHGKQRRIRELMDKIDGLEGEEKKLAEMIAGERQRSEKLKKQSEQCILKSRKQIEESKIESQKRIQKQKEESLKYQKMLEEYQAEEQKLKNLMKREQEEMGQLSKAKQAQIQELIRQKELEIEKQRKNNKLLWTDNKKLKDMEQKLKEEADRQMKQIELKKKQEIDRLRQQLQRKFEKEANLQQQQESNSHELKKILQEKANQIKIITENHNKTKTELEFYKNRNKELEGVVSRTEKTFKQQMLALERDNKTNKEVISVLDKKMTEVNLVKQEIERKSKQDIERLSDQLQYLKDKYEGQRIEQKIMLLSKSIQQFDSSLRAVGNTLSCNYCVETVKECVRMKECGHIYCKKCRAGYEPNCGECKRNGTAASDKMIDDTVSKTEYMKILLATVKEDISKIAL